MVQIKFKNSWITLVSILFCAKLMYCMPWNNLSGEADAAGVGVSMDNDARYFTLVGLDEDRYYSQGLRIFWSGKPQNISSAKGLNLKVGKVLNATYTAYRIGLSQEVFTPNDLMATPPMIVDDRAFAGWTHLDLGERFYFGWKNMPARLTTEISVGFVGPASKADDVQIWFHDQRRKTSDKPELDPDPTIGWQNQYAQRGIPYRLQLNLYQGVRPIHIRNKNAIDFDLGLESGLRAGHLYGQVFTAAEIRAGRLSRSMYSPLPEGNTKEWEVFMFGKSRIVAVGWNEIINGKNDSEVELARLLWQNELGFTIGGPKYVPDLSWALHIWSRETANNPTDPFQQGHIDYRPELQDRNALFDHAFGTFQLSWNW